MDLESQALTDSQKLLIANHYSDALKIGQMFKSSVLYDDEKETIAVKALIRAAQNFREDYKTETYNVPLISKSNRSLFNTYLYKVVKNALLSAGRTFKNGHYEVRNKRLPKNAVVNESTIEAKAEETDSVKNLSTMFSVPDTSQSFEFDNLMTIINTRLSDRQRFILTALISPETVGCPLSKHGTPKVTNSFLADLLGVTKQRINQEIYQIRSVVRKILENSDNRFLQFKETI